MADDDREAFPRLSPHPVPHGEAYADILAMLLRAKCAVFGIPASLLPCPPSTTEEDRDE